MTVILVFLFVLYIIWGIALREERIKENMQILSDLYSEEELVKESYDQPFLNSVVEVVCLPVMVIWYVLFDKGEE